MMKRRDVETCCQADQFCVAPANLDPPRHVRTKCFKCGGAVCRECSIEITYFKFGVQRLCHNCVEEVDGNDLRIVRKIIVQAGYPEGTPGFVNEWNWQTRQYDRSTGKYTPTPLPPDYPRKTRPCSKRSVRPSTRRTPTASSSRSSSTRHR